MRHYQRGIATTVILIIFLLSGIAIASAYFVFSQKQQASKAINSFEDCAKLYPVMESFPEQCNTPDGKNFTRLLAEEEKQRLIPPQEPSPSAGENVNPDSIGANWKAYTNEDLRLQFKYPPEGKITRGGSYGVDNVLIKDQNTVSILIEGLQIIISVKPTNKKEIDYFKTEYGEEGIDYDGKKIEEVYIDGIKTLKGAMAGPKSNKIFILINDGKVYYISFEPEVTKTGEMILNSIKFLK